MSEFQPSDFQPDFEPTEVTPEHVPSMLNARMNRRDVLRNAFMASAVLLGTAACGKDRDDWEAQRDKWVSEVPAGPEYHKVSEAEWEAIAGQVDNRTRGFAQRLSGQAGTLYVYKGQDAATLYSTQAGDFLPGIKVNYDGYNSVTLSKQALLPPSNSPNAEANNRLYFSAQYAMPNFNGERISVGAIVRSENAPLVATLFVDDGLNGGVSIYRNDKGTVDLVVPGGAPADIPDVHRSVQVATDHVSDVATRLGLGG